MPDKQKIDEKVFKWNLDSGMKQEEEPEIVDPFKTSFMKTEESDAVQNKREMLQQQAADRVSKLKGMSTPVDADNFKEKLDVPAYLRKEVRLQDVPHSSEKNISRYQLNDDNQILGHNKFLHDNVD